jgi:hypothetical protein
MCMQCMMSAMGAGAAVTGTRSFIAAGRFSWLTARRLRAVTAALLASGLLASALLVSGSSAKPAGRNGAPPPSQSQR